MLKKIVQLSAGTTVSSEVVGQTIRDKHLVFVWTTFGIRMMDNYQRCQPNYLQGGRVGGSEGTTG